MVVANLGHRLLNYTIFGFTDSLRIAGGGLFYSIYIELQEIRNGTFFTSRLNIITQSPQSENSSITFKLNVITWPKVIA